ncbi:hypothetical protein IG631_05641 [Alternaria alternata]|nr:hypothetical protein IG631_05641 [Alternaria alternata]
MHLHSPTLHLQRWSRAAANPAIGQGLLLLATTLVHTTMALYVRLRIDAGLFEVQSSKFPIVDSRFAMSKDGYTSSSMCCTRETIVNSSSVQFVFSLRHRTRFMYRPLGFRIGSISAINLSRRVSVIVPSTQENSCCGSQRYDKVLRLYLIPTLAIIIGR